MKEELSTCAIMIVVCFDTRRIFDPFHMAKWEKYYIITWMKKYFTGPLFCNY
jgi:hypothetical protein